MARAHPPRLLQVVREPINAGAEAAYEAVDADGPVFEQPDGTYFAVRFLKTLEEANRLANNDATILGFHPCWGLPAQEWIDADADFWSVNPVAPQRKRVE
jgi:hypothetical protein